MGKALKVNRGGAIEEFEITFKNTNASGTTRGCINGIAWVYLSPGGTTTKKIQKGVSIVTDKAVTISGCGSQNTDMSSVIIIQISQNGTITML